MKQCANMRNAISIGILAHYLIGTLFYSYRNDRAGLLRIVLAVCQPMVNREITHNKITGTRKNQAFQPVRNE